MHYKIIHFAITLAVITYAVSHMDPKVIPFIYVASAVAGLTAFLLRPKPEKK